MNAEYKNENHNGFLRLEYEEPSHKYKEVNVANILKHVQYLGEDIIVYHYKPSLQKGNHKLTVVRSDTWKEREEDLVNGLSDLIYIIRNGEFELAEDKAEELVELAKDEIRRKKVEGMEFPQEGDGSC